MRCTSVSFLTGAVLCLASLEPALADIYKCVDDTGHVTYSNVDKKGCKRMTLDTLSTIPGGSGARPAAAPKPGGGAAASPSTFPKVDDDTQKKRDTDRRRILEQELNAEEKNLEQAKKDLSEQEAVRSGDERNYQRVLDRLQPYKDRVAQHERNIESLKRETSNLR